MKRFLSTLLVLIGLLVAADAAAVLKPEGRLGGFTAVKDVNDPYVVEVAEFAVEEHNKQAGTKLEYVKVVSGEQQVVAGTNYRLVISAKGDGGDEAEYLAVVYDKPWEKFRSLTSFDKA